MTMIEGDLVDETFYDAERNNMKLQALAEMLESWGNNSNDYSSPFLSSPI